MLPTGNHGHSFVGYWHLRFDSPPLRSNSSPTGFVKTSPAEPGSVVDAIEMKGDGGGNGGGCDTTFVDPEEGRGGGRLGKAEGAVGDGGDGGRSICRRVLCR